MDNPPKYPCPALPEGWLRQVVQRRSGLSAGKCDVYYYSPSGEKLRSKFQLGLRLGNILDISRFDYTTGEMADEPIKEKSTDGGSSPKKRGSTKTETPKPRKKEKIVVKFGSPIYKIPSAALDIKTEGELDFNSSLNDSADALPEVSTPNKAQISGSLGSGSKRGNKRKRASEGSPSKIQKAIKQELLDHELTRAEEEVSPTAETRQRVNGHRKSGKVGGVYKIRELQVNLGEKLGHKELEEQGHVIKTEPSEQTRQPSAGNRLSRQRQSAFAVEQMVGHKSPPRRRSPEKGKSASPSSKKNAKRQKSPPKKSPGSPGAKPKNKKNPPYAAPRDIDEQGTASLDLELQELRRKLDEIKQFVATERNPDNNDVFQEFEPQSSSSTRNRKPQFDKRDREAIDKCLTILSKLVDKDESSVFGHFVANELRCLQHAPDLQTKLKNLIQEAVIQVTSEFSEMLASAPSSDHEPDALEDE